MSLTLYHLVDEYVAALQTLESLQESGQLSSEVVADTLEGMAGSLEVKSNNVIGYALSLEAEAAAIKAAIEPMLARAKALEKKSAWMREYVFNAMERTGINEIKSPHYVIKVRENPASVIIDNEAGIPADCWRVIPERREPDKSAIKEKIKNGEIVEYAHLSKSKRLDVK
jgi:hypothetical protein